MNPLTASDILNVWEQGEGQSAIERPLTILAVACPELTRAELSALSIGLRDALLFESRELTIGPRLDGFTACPRCQERLEFTLDLAALPHRPTTMQADEEFELELDGNPLRFRLPNSGDLAAVAVCEDLATARRRLAERCVRQASLNGNTMLRLSDDLVTKLAEQIESNAPEAEVMLDFACPSCGRNWQSLFDIAEFFWAEIAAQARRLLREIHLLASAYGWREVDVLALSVRRRQAYLEMIG